MKPREFWITNIDGNGIPSVFEEKPILPFHSCHHVREVVPIDWEKIDIQLRRACDDTLTWPYVLNEIKQLVEKQLRGKE